MQKLFFLQAQEQGIFYDNGKIYVVVACCLIILFGLTAYLIFLEKKYTKK